jgi:hypothetical protein
MKTEIAMRPTKKVKSVGRTIPVAIFLASTFAPVIRMGDASKTRLRAARLVVQKAALVMAVAWLSCQSLLAHPSPNSAVSLDFHHDGVVVDLTLPLAELELGFKRPLMTAPSDVLLKYRGALGDYVLAHVKPTTEEGRPWQVSVQGMETKLNEKPMDLVVHLWMQPPAGAPARKFNFNYSVINHEVMSHWVMVYVRNDWNTAVFSSKPEPDHGYRQSWGKRT